MKIYVWPNGHWIYEWEQHGFTMEHSAILEGGRWIDLDRLYGLGPIGFFSASELKAIDEALGE